MIAGGLFLLLAGLNHVVEIVREKNYAPGNTAILISEPFLTLAAVTDRFFSCLVPTLFAGIRTAAEEALPGHKSAIREITVGKDGRGTLLRIRSIMGGVVSLVPPPP
jgi:hypothetical protein